MLRLKKNKKNAHIRKKPRFCRSSSIQTSDEAAVSVAVIVNVKIVEVNFKQRGCKKRIN